MDANEPAYIGMIALAACKGWYRPYDKMRGCQYGFENCAYAVPVDVWEPMNRLASTTIPTREATVPPGECKKKTKSAGLGGPSTAGNRPCVRKSSAVTCANVFDP